MYLFPSIAIAYVQYSKKIFKKDALKDVQHVQVYAYGLYNRVGDIVCKSMETKVIQSKNVGKWQRKLKFQVSYKRKETIERRITANVEVTFVVGSKREDIATMLT